MQPITEEFIALGRSAAGGWTRVQLAALGVPWPPLKGWKATVLGKSISDGEAAAFLNVRVSPIQQKS
jgi:hypothetical protein